MLVSVGQRGSVKADPSLQEGLLSASIHYPAECARLAQGLMRALSREQSQGC